MIDLRDFRELRVLLHRAARQHEDFCAPLEPQTSPRVPRDRIAFHTLCALASASPSSLVFCLPSKPNGLATFVLLLPRTGTFLIYPFPSSLLLTLRSKSTSVRCPDPLDYFKSPPTVCCLSTCNYPPSTCRHSNSLHSNSIHT